MPANHRLRSDDHQRLFPARPYGAQANPQQPIGIAESGFPCGAVQHEELVPQGQVLKQECAARLEDCCEGPKPGDNYGRNDPGSSDHLIERSTNSTPDEVFATHNQAVGPCMPSQRGGLRQRRTVDSW